MGSSAGLFVNFEDDQNVQINMGSHWNYITWSNLVQVNFFTARCKYCNRVKTNLNKMIIILLKKIIFTGNTIK